MSPQDLSQILTLPGNGVFTVHTASDLKKTVQKNLFPNAKDSEYEAEWKKSLESFLQDSKKNKALMGICSDNGGGILRGANWGPLFIREHLLKYQDYTKKLHDLGDIRVIPHLLHDKYLNLETIGKCREALYGDSQTQLPVSPLSMTEYALDVLYQHKKDLKIVALGGDHSVSFPLVKAYLKHKNRCGIKTGLIHFDAHTDLLTERLGIDYCFGSWVSHIVDDLPSPQNLYQIGIRSTGKDRNHWEKSFGINQIWKKEVDELGVQELCSRIIKGLKEQDVEEIYVSFDIDALDSSFASATGTPEEDGLSPDQCTEILQRLFEVFPLTGADLVEVAPFLKTRQTINPEPDSTLFCAEAILNCYMDHL